MDYLILNNSRLDPNDLVSKRQVARDVDGRLWTAVIDFTPTPDTLCAYYSDDSGVTWHLDAIIAATNSAMIYTPSIATDKYNNVHVIWSDTGYGANPTYHNIQYRKRVGGIWQARESVTDLAQGVIAAALAVDSNGNPYVNYPRGTGAGANFRYDLFLARRLPPWASENITNYPAGALMWQVCSIAIDKNDTIHMTWDMRDRGPGPWWLHVCYIQGTPGAWGAIEQVDTQPLAARTQYWSCIAVDFNNDAHVVWRGIGWGVNDWKYNIQYRKRESGVWQAQEAVTDKAADQLSPSIALERATGNLWVAYWEFAVGTRVRQRTAGGWQPEHVVVNGQALNLLWAVNPSSNMPSTGCCGVYLLSPAPGQSRYYAPGTGPTWKPEAPTNLVATAISDTQIDLAWTKGAGAVNTVIRRKVGAYPANVADGDEAYNGPSDSCSDIGLVAATTYYYRAWSYTAPNYSDDYAQDFATTLAGPPFPAAPAVTTESANTINQTEASPYGTLDNDGGEACDCWFEYGVAGGTIYTTPTQSRTTGEIFTVALSGLVHDTRYHFRAIARNSTGTTYGANMYFVTESPALVACSPVQQVLLGEL